MTITNIFSQMAQAFMLSWPYGLARVMSSYYWDQNFVNGQVLIMKFHNFSIFFKFKLSYQDANDWVGPPVDSNWNIASPTINADGTCGGGWMCEHRWRQIRNMVKFRNVVDGESTQTSHLSLFISTGETD